MGVRVRGAARGRFWVDTFKTLGAFIDGATDVINGDKLFREMLKDIKPYNLFMSSSAGWVEECRKLYGERLVAFERYSFSSEKLSLEHLKRLCQSSAHDIKQMDSALLEKVWRQDHFTFITSESFAFLFIIFI